jgi:hypothetical protein
MRQVSWWAAVVATGLSLAAAGRLVLTAAEEPQEKSKDHIVPTVRLKPDETKDVELSSSCARVSRRRGLLLREMGEKVDAGEKTWARDGVSVSFVDGKDAAEPDVLKKKGLKSFTVRVVASRESKPCLFELHVADETCSRTCDVDLRVVVVAP